MPASTCLRMTSAIPSRSRGCNSLASMARPAMTSLDVCIKSGGPSSLPAWVVRIRPVLCFIRMSSRDQSCIGADYTLWKQNEESKPELRRMDTTLAEQNNGAGDCQYSSPKQIQVEPCRAQQCKAEPPVHNPRGEAC